ncbi:MAG: hypothetical protein IKW41_04580 [Phascolarctobacterium sp.]|nr:hypothetical protein [Phascolarctobacterium sp.]
MAGGPGKINDYNKAIPAIERKGNARKAGKASVKARRKKKTMQELMKATLALALKKDGKITDAEIEQSLPGLAGQNMSVMQALVLAQVKKGLEGDGNAFDRIMELVGEKVSKQEITLNTNPYTSLSDAELKKLAELDE